MKQKHTSWWQRQSGFTKVYIIVLTVIVATLLSAMLFIYVSKDPVIAGELSLGVAIIVVVALGVSTVVHNGIMIANHERLCDAVIKDIEVIINDLLYDGFDESENLVAKQDGGTTELSTEDLAAVRQAIKERQESTTPEKKQQDILKDTNKSLAESYVFPPGTKIVFNEGPSPKPQPALGDTQEFELPRSTDKVCRMIPSDQRNASTKEIDTKAVRAELDKQQQQQPDPPETSQTQAKLSVEEQIAELRLPPAYLKWYLQHHNCNNYDDLSQEQIDALKRMAATRITAS